jgi:hypothetical protein
MSPTRTRLAALGLVAGIAATARAQDGFMAVDNSSTFYGPAITAAGDMAQGMGALYQGVGQYNYDTARANAINASTLMQYNEYVYLCRKNWNRERLQRIHYKAAKNKEAFNAIQMRIRQSPTEDDIYSGDALNALMEDISGALLGPSVTSYATRSFEGALVPGIPFQIPALGGGVSLRRMLPEQPIDWPLLLRDRPFDADRARYVKSVEDLLERAHEGRLGAAEVKAVRAAVDRLAARARPLIDKEPDAQTRIETREFLKELDGQARRLQAAYVETMLVEIDRYHGTTMGEFVEFMQRFNLRFGPARTPGERDLYARLFALLKEEQVALAGAVMGPEPGGLPRERVQPPDAEAAAFPADAR